MDLNPKDLSILTSSQPDSVTTVNHAETLIDQLLQTFQKRRSLRAGSLIISIYGDAIAPHGGVIWLGSLIRLLEPFGVSSRLVRTSVYRLSKENWLQSQSIGRRSYYSLTSSGRRRFEAAYRQVYAAQGTPWNGQWCLLMLDLPGIDSEQRETIRRELLWQGFGALAPWVLIHPGIDSESVLTTLEEFAVADKALMMIAHSEIADTKQALHELVNKCWDLARLSELYRRFLADFQPLLTALQDDEKPDPRRCFLVRTLLIHQYRRLLLRDPHLPNELLPEDWSGNKARSVCRDLYRQVQAEAEDYLMTTAEAIDGPLAAVETYFYQRFGGL